MASAALNNSMIIVPFTVLVDGREKAPYHFTGLRADVKQRRRPLQITTKWARLESGDYSIDGLQDRVSVERKSLDDLYSTLGQHRNRFKRELARLTDLDCAAVVIEAEWSTILQSPPMWSRLVPKVIYRSILSWQQTFPTVQWLTLPDRRVAEITTFRILERFYRECQANRHATSR